MKTAEVNALQAAAMEVQERAARVEEIKLELVRIGNEQDAKARELKAETDLLGRARAHLLEIAGDKPDDTYYARPPKCAIASCRETAIPKSNYCRAHQSLKARQKARQEAIEQ